MGVIHFMNVKEGDCIWIEHPSGHNTVIDVSNGNEDGEVCEAMYDNLQGNHHQKEHPVNPIEYLKKFKVSSIFRFVLTHPDMDHMDGLEALFNNFTVNNFWDTDNNKEMEEGTNWGKYKASDWEYYQKIRKFEENPKTLHLYSGSKGKYYNLAEDGNSGADGLYILAPTKQLVENANETKDYNDASYVILYRTGNGKKVVFAGDSAKKTWDYILEKHRDDVENIDLLIAPHHGRKSGGNDEYLDVLNPSLTLFGNAKSQYLDYNSWNNRGLDHITNNQANTIVVNTNGKDGLEIYCTYEIYAKKRNPDSYFEEKYDAWYIMTL